MDVIEDSRICYCRLCGTAGFLFEIFSETNNNLSTKIKYCLDLPISEHDDLPKEICAECENKVDLFNNFKLQCHLTEKKFRGEIKWTEDEHEIFDTTATYSNNAQYENCKSTPLEIDQSKLCFTSDQNITTNSLKYNDLEITEAVQYPIPIFEKDQTKVIDNKVHGVVAKENRSYKELEDILKSINEISNNNQLRYKDNKFPCKHCYRSFKESQFLENHVKVMHKTDLLKCDMCETIFTRAVNLRRHKLRVHQKLKRYCCHMCGAKFFNKKELDGHLVTHAEAIYKCPTCEKKFATTKRLIKHQNIHLPIAKNEQISNTSEPVSCSKCNEIFPTYAAYKTHSRIHKELRYACEICGKCFKDASNFCAHRKVHSNIKPHKCLICDKRFAQSNHLKRHLGSHSIERPFHCTYCEKTFKFNDSLKDHIKKHTGENKTYACEICSKIFMEKRGLRKHLTIIHKKDVESYEQQFE